MGDGGSRAGQVRNEYRKPANDPTCLTFLKGKQIYCDGLGPPVPSENSVLFLISISSTYFPL